MEARYNGEHTVPFSEKWIGNTKMKPYHRILLIVAIAILFPVSGRASATTTVAADGAVGVNASWEAGTSSAWYIELQRLGAQDICTGIEREDDTLIQQGIHIVNWGFAHEGADGSYPGTGDPFHSTAIFAEATAYATLQLKQYHPVTYTANYASVVSTYTADLHATGLWLTTPSVATVGQQGDLPYTHRRYMLAATLAEIGALSGDSTLTAAAVPYVTNGLALQMTSGTEAIAYPDGVHTISMAGVNPEMGGYDVSYQGAGINYAEHYYTTCTDETLRASLRAMMMAGLSWECGRISVLGALDTVGSTRVGIELNRDGTVKQPNAQEIISALSHGSTDAGQKKFLVSAYRYVYFGRAVTSDTVGSDGAVNGNIGWEAGTATTWNIGQQRIGADYIDQGISCENDAMIRQGILILNWGWSHQLANGSFGTTSTPYYSAAQFIEAGARAALALKAYSPVTYTADTAYYASTASTFAQKSNATAAWLTTSTNWPIVVNNAATSTCRNFALAAGLATTGAAAANTALFTYADQSATKGDSMQTSTGMDPEGGVSDINNQALGLTYAARYILNTPADAATSTTATALSKGLEWEMQWVNVDGTVSGVSSPATKTIDTANKLGYGLLGDARFMVVRQRLNLPEMLILSN
jgi:hypothetical protein